MVALHFCDVTLSAKNAQSVTYPKILNTIGDRLQYRIKKGLSLRRLAKELGIDPGTLAGWEKGENEPRGKLKKPLDSLLMTLTM